MNEHVRNYVVNKKVWNNSQNVSYFRFLKVATLCCVHSAANPWPSLTELHDVVTTSGFHLTGVSCQGSFAEFLAFLMGMGPSVVLCRSQVSTQLTNLFDNCKNSYSDNQLSKEKRQSIITLRTEGQSVWKIGPECSHKSHQALRRNWLRWGQPQESMTKSHLCCCGSD